jgi:cobalt/nickel transport system permease protein
MAVESEGAVENNGVVRTAMGFGSIMNNSYGIGRMGIWRMDEMGGQATPLHRMDARIKILTVFIFIGFVMSFPRYEISALMPFFLFPLVLMGRAGIPPSYIFKKVLIASPFALAVGIFNPWLDPAPMIRVGGIFVSGGWLSFLSILIRFSLTVSVALTLLACTGIQRLCDGMGRMGVPQVLVVQLQLLYRYLFVVVEEGGRLGRGLALRAGPRSRITLRTYGALVGHLLLRSLDRAQRVYQAMASRGYTGETRMMHPPVLRRVDLLFLVGWVLFFGVARYWNLAGQMGRLLIGGGR